MEMERRIGPFVQLGKDIEKVCAQWNGEIDSVPATWRKVMEKAKHENGWFSYQNQINALNGIRILLDEKAIREAIQPYLAEFTVEKPKTVAVIMAGNIPAVNFLDFMAVLLSGNVFLGKLSSDDPYWLPFLANELSELEPGLKPFIQFEKEVIKTSFDAVMATGSNNTARYFEYYFDRYPHIIRKNRTSVAILDGTETVEEMKSLGKDISDYYGMGCRNVSKLFVPEGYDFIPLLKCLEEFNSLTENHKFVNNYEYHRSVFLLNGDAFYDNGVYLFKSNHGLGAPVGTVFYDFYKDKQELVAKLWIDEQQIQCTVAGGEKQFPRQVAFGGSQCPSLSDFPDNVNVFEFLAGL